jgi:hypothetical protein
MERSCLVVRLECRESSRQEHNLPLIWREQSKEHEIKRLKMQQSGFYWESAARR